MAMINIPLDKMTTEEKLQAMELIWDDLRGRAENVNSPKWHEDVLRNRAKALANGTETAEDWEDAKQSIRRELSLA